MQPGSTAPGPHRILRQLAHGFDHLGQGGFLSAVGNWVFSFLSRPVDHRAVAAHLQPGLLLQECLTSADGGVVLAVERQGLQQPRQVASGGQGRGHGVHLSRHLLRNQGIGVQQLGELLRFKGELGSVLLHSFHNRLQVKGHRQLRGAGIEIARGLLVAQQYLAVCPLGQHQAPGSA